jgi:hypothetical protein
MNRYAYRWLSKEWIQKRRNDECAPIQDPGADQAEVSDLCRKDFMARLKAILSGSKLFIRNIRYRFYWKPHKPLLRCDIRSTASAAKSGLAGCRFPLAFSSAAQYGLASGQCLCQCHPASTPLLRAKTKSLPQPIAG